MKVNKHIQILAGIFLLAAALTAVFLIFFKGGDNPDAPSPENNFNIPSAPEATTPKPNSGPSSNIVLNENPPLPEIEEPVLPTPSQEIDPNMRPYMGSYEIYSPERFAQATGDVVLFFRTPACNPCQTLDNNIRSYLSSIPKDILIFDVNFESETALREKYAVTLPHTLVQTGPNGLLITKWQGSTTLAQLLQAIK